MPDFKQTVVHPPVNAEAWIWSHASLCETGGGQNDNGAGFLQSASVFHCQYHSTSAAYSWLS